MGQEQPLFCFDDYTSPFTSVKEGNVIRGQVLGRGKESWWCFCSLSYALCPFWRIRADVASDKQTMKQLMSGVCDKELHHPFLKQLSNLLLIHFPKGFTCLHLNTLHTTLVQPGKRSQKIS